jgi:hypothetical protein
MHVGVPRDRRWLVHLSIVLRPRKPARLGSEAHEPHMRRNMVVTAPVKGWPWFAGCEVSSPVLPFHPTGRS